MTDTNLAIPEDTPSPPEELPWADETIDRRPRVTVVESVYHETPLEGVVGPKPARFSSYLNTTEQSFDRLVTVGHEWVPISLGWVQHCSMLRIMNATKKPLGKINREESEDWDKRVLQLALQVGHQMVLLSTLAPGLGSRLAFPSCVDMMRVRCLHKTATVHYFAVPA